MVLAIFGGSGGIQEEVLRCFRKMLVIIKRSGRFSKVREGSEWCYMVSNRLYEVL